MSQSGQQPPPAKKDFTSDTIGSNIPIVESEEVRCHNMRKPNEICNALLFKGRIDTGAIEIKCWKCRKISRLKFMS